MRTLGDDLSPPKTCSRPPGGPGLEQVANVASLPGIVGASLAMPDIHWGYGFCIGGVAATDVGRRRRHLAGRRGLRHQLRRAAAADEPDARRRSRPRLKDLVDQLFRDVPAGRGRRRARSSSAARSCAAGAAEGARAWAVSAASAGADGPRAHRGRRLPGRAPTRTRSAPAACERGRRPVRHARARGNHFLEVQVRRRDLRRARGRGDGPGRGPGDGHDPLRLARPGLPGLRRRPRASCCERPAKYGIELPDRQLACAPVTQPGGRSSTSAAMRAAANFAWANRQLMATGTRRGLRAVLRTRPARRWACDLVYDVAHNIAKIEDARWSTGEARRLCVHRKGATRAFPPGHPEVPAGYRAIGQPVIIPGDMGRGQLRAGRHASGPWSETFGTTCHGAGRRDEPHRRKQRRQGPADRPRAGRPRASSPGRVATGPSPRSSPRPTRTWPTSSTSCAGAGICQARSRGSGRSG